MKTVNSVVPQTRMRLYSSALASASRRNVDDDARERKFIKENVVVSRLAHAKQPSLAIQIIVEFNRADDTRVDDRARGAVTALVSLKVGSGEENYIVVLAHDDECDFRFKPQFFTGAFDGIRDHWESKEERKQDVLRMRLSSSPIIAANSPSNTPSGGHKSVGSRAAPRNRFTHRDRTECVWETCPSYP